MLILQQLTAEYLDNGAYQLRWQPSSEKCAMRIAVALQPGEVGQTTMHTCSSLGQVVVDELSSVDRHFFTLIPDHGPHYSIATRHLTFAGAKNFRDVGGYDTLHGGKIKWGKLYRSGHLSGLTDEDLNKLAGLGVYQVFDFRDLEERAKRPNRYPAKPPLDQSLPIVPGSSRQFLMKASSGELDAQFVVEFMELINQELASVYYPQYQAMFRALLVGEGRPVVMHCAAGKDRTGLAIALILAALGVDEEVIMDDYMLSNRYITTREDSVRVAKEVEAKVGRPIAPEQIQPMFEVRPSYLQQALQTISEMHGSIDSYLTACMGLSMADREKLQSYYVE